MRKFKITNMTKEQFTKEFEQARPQLKSYILRITASVQIRKILFRTLT